jgi:flagellar motor protein MotB
MKQSIAYKLAVFLVATAGLVSCVPQQKVTDAKKELAVVDSTLTTQKVTLTNLGEQVKKKQEQNEMDDTSSARIKNYIARTTSEIDSLRDNHLIRIGEAVVNKSDWESLLQTLAFARRSAKSISEKINFLSDLISQNTVVKIDQDVFFGPGSYSVSPAMAKSIEKIFEPAALEIDKFTKKYPDFPLSLVITAKGYADATTISEGTNLHKELTDRLKLSGTDPDNKALNKELSNARAQQVIELFKKYASSRAGSQGYIRNILYLHEGKGEALPNPRINDYSMADPRRRVVYLFWSVFPE